MNTAKLVCKLLFLTIVFYLGAMNACAEEVVYKPTSSNKIKVDMGIQPTDAYVEFITNSTYITTLIGGQYMTLTLHGYEGKRISHVVLSMKSDDYIGTGDIIIKAGSNVLATFNRAEFDAWVEPHRKIYQDLDIVICPPNYIIGDEDITIRIDGTTTYICCQSFRIIYDDGAVSFKATDGVNYYATFSHNDAVAFPKQLSDGRKLHAEVISVDNNVITKKDLVNDFGCESGDQIIVPANTGVLLRVEGANSAPVVDYSIYTDVLSEQTVASVKASNMLIPCLATGKCPLAEGSNAYYKLAYGNNTTKQNLGFWYGEERGSNNFQVKGNGAVLCVPQSLNSNVRGFSLDATGVVTGIDSVVDEQTDDVIYNLKGMHVSSRERGVSIKNGRKVLY